MNRRTRVALLLASVTAALTATLVTPPAASSAPTPARHADVSTQALSRTTIAETANGEVGNSEANGGCLKYGPCRSNEWCAMFAEWVWRTAGVPEVPTTWVATSVGQWGVDRGLFKTRPDGARGNPLPGDIVVYGAPGSGTGGHVSIVYSVNANGTITTIDGNSTGEAVVRNTINPVTARAGSRDVLISGYVTPPGVNDSAQVSRFAFLNSDGHLFAKDELYGSWLDFNGGGASRMVTSGDWTGAIGNGNFYAKQGLYGSWLTMASGGQVTDIAISGERFAFVTSAGDVLGKDGVNSSWTVLWSGGASKVVLDGDRIGVLANGNFHAKQGLHGGWVTMASGGQVTDIAISGERFGFANSDKHAFVKDGQNASWVDVHSGVTGLTITPQWIGVIVGGNFLAKQGLYDTWYTMASGGGATKIVINGDWFGMIAGGNFLAKQGLYGSWMTMAAGGQATQMNITTIS